MNKLLKLKRWLTVSEAARYLSSVLERRVSRADVLRLALDGQLKLSVSMGRPRGSSAVPSRDARPQKPPRRSTTPPAQQQRLILGDEEKELEEDLPTPDGVYDLPIAGSEQLNVEPKPKFSIRLAQNNSPYYAELERGPLEKKGQKKRAVRSRNIRAKSETLSHSLPRGSLLVVRLEALLDLQERLAAAESSTDKALGIREETTYHNIIGGLLELILHQPQASEPQPALKDQTAIISALLDRHDGKPGITKRTLEDKFAASKRTLRST